MNINRQQLELEYQKYINQLAQEYLEKGSLDQNLLKVISVIQNKIRDLDVIEAVNNLKENQHVKKYHI